MFERSTTDTSVSTKAAECLVLIMKGLHAWQTIPAYSGIQNRKKLSKAAKQHLLPLGVDFSGITIESSVPNHG